MDLERVKTKSPEDLASIWNDYHLGRGHIGASMKAKLYYLLTRRAEDCCYLSFRYGEEVVTQPCFVKMPHILFIGLEDYKARGTQAAPYFAVTYDTDFSDSKDLVLVRGDNVFTSKLSDEEAKLLIETTQFI